MMGLLNRTERDGKWYEVNRAKSERLALGRIAKSTGQVAQISLVCIVPTPEPVQSIFYDQDADNFRWLVDPRPDLATVVGNVAYLVDNPKYNFHTS